MSDDLIQQARDHAAAQRIAEHLRLLVPFASHAGLNPEPLHDAATLLVSLADEVERLREDGMRSAIDWLEREADARAAIIKRLLSTDPSHADLSAYLREHDVLSTAASFMVNRDAPLAGEQGDDHE